MPCKIRTMFEQFLCVIEVQLVSVIQYSHGHEKEENCHEAMDILLHVSRTVKSAVNMW